MLQGVQQLFHSNCLSFQFGLSLFQNLRDASRPKHSSTSRQLMSMLFNGCFFDGHFVKRRHSTSGFNCRLFGSELFCFLFASYFCFLFSKIYCYIRFFCPKNNHRSQWLQGTFPYINYECDTVSFRAFCTVRIAQNERQYLDAFVHYFARFM